ncbi:hypothetical protein GGR54DRAFT_565448 [Hypoxylon sp. NC1633]|nr:hypothetical protein GGR54DRAFT_565448 [Hypoxylon sp. NC1633]
MLFSAVSSLAILALAGQAIAEPLRQPYKLKLARMSTRSLFGLDRRQEDQGYSPNQEFCNKGDTCAEACGKGYEQCLSKDGLVHCYNKSAKQTCCPGMTGDSCDAGYFCTADDKGASWCCPDSMTLEQCAVAYNLPGSLISEAAPSTSSSSSSTKSSSSTHTTATTNTNASSTKEGITPNIASSTSVPDAYGVQTSVPVVTATSTAIVTPATPAPTPAASSASPTPPTNGIVAAGSDSIHSSMSGAVLIAAALFAALL